MREALRPYVTAGLALAGASVIAVAPVAPPPDLDVSATPTSSTDVALTALVNPVEEFIEVFQVAFQNGAAIGSRIIADPAPILTVIAENQLITAEFLAGLGQTYLSGLVSRLGMVPANVQGALEMIEAGDIEDGFSQLVFSFTTIPFLGAALPLLGQLPTLADVLGNPFANAQNVIDQLFGGAIMELLPLATGIFGPVLQIGVTGQAVYDALQADDFEAALNAIISFPSDLLGTTLNGSPALGGGLLGEEGVVNALLNLRDLIAGAIQPPPVPSSTTNALADESKMITVSTEQTSPGLDGSTPPPQDGAPAVPGEGDTAEEGEVEVAAEGTEGDGELPVDGEAQEPEDTQLRPGQRLFKDFQQAGERIEQRFREAGERFDEAIDRLTGRGHGDKAVRDVTDDKDDKDDKDDSGNAGGAGSDADTRAGDDNGSDAGDEGSDGGDS